jgi:hypothetical protein
MTASLATQRQAMARLSALDGIWRGPAWALGRSGRRNLVQTERVGAFLGGSVRVVEGRAYEADGSVGFNALGVISFDPATNRYSLRSWAQGRTGEFPLRIAEDGAIVWEMPVGPNMIIRHTAHIGDGRWHEISELIREGVPPMQVGELDLRRIGDSDWPAGSAVPMADGGPR